MNPLILLRRGKGPGWGSLERLALATPRLHVPVGPNYRPSYRVLSALHIGVREGWLWSLRLLWFEPPFRSQCAAVRPGLAIELLQFIQGYGRIILGDDVRLSGNPSFGFLNRWEETDRRPPDGRPVRGVAL
ncbi:MAG: hypothetical protein ACHRXM_26875 [Isosphaerales bacterium]